MTPRPTASGPVRLRPASLVRAAALVAALLLPVAAFSADQPSPRVKAILDLVERNPSPQAVRDALKRANLSKAEAQELATEIKKPRYDAALRSLRMKAEAERFGPGVPQPVPRNVDIRALRQTIQQEHATRLVRLQAQAQGALQAPVRAVTSVRRPDPAVVARMGPFVATRPQPQESPIFMLAYTPQPLVTGRELTTLGLNFGTPGFVTIILGAEDPRPENAFDCRIVTWSSGGVKCVVPEAIEDVHRSRPFPNFRRSVLIWVKPKDDPAGRVVQTEVTLNPDHFQPAIDSVVPNELTPGLRFAILGHDLSAGSEPHVTIDDNMTGPGYNLRVRRFEPDWLEVEVPEDQGHLRAGPVYLKVSNGLAEGRPKAVNFIPAEEVLEFHHEGYASCYSLLGEFSGGHLEGLCWLGDIVRDYPFTSIQHDGYTATRLVNGWTVAGVAATVTSHHGERAGCYFEHAPSAGAILFASTELVSWADPYCQVTCQATLTIRGPRDVPISP